MAIQNFVAYNPVRLHFGEGVVQTLGETIKQYGKHVLLLYGKGSVKKYGYYDEVTGILKNAGLQITEFGGIQPNPLVDDVRRAIALGKEKKVDVILALGGGSVIDSAKIVSVGLVHDIDPWQFMLWQAFPEQSVPLVTVLTLAATGTEMNAAAVLQNTETGKKVGFVHPELFPKDSFLDPAYTVTVPKDYTAYGIADLIAHALEAFFGKGEPSVIDRITVDIIKDAMEQAPLLLNDLKNTAWRANIMLDATLALNGLTNYGRSSGDWGVHALGHELSLLYGMPHGATLSIVYPAWLKLQAGRIPKRIQKLGDLLFGLTDIETVIQKLEVFFKSIDCPVRLADAGIDESKKEEILHQMNKNQDSGMVYLLNDADRKQIVEYM
ncbi:iron-containing alcohol dehydrogenase [Candidatus Sulfidibacterium hydrothermale]|uniref:iron-containing alcohol dehydrogenase n=1 Tax=Candidatus Sulfidibacterium hydrothermale TaxID=2875962 RepID=UPI001F0A68AB|nr:iron-containing alcohol dehydrogenase [Candidatus Sulfidibacterium hydrothermale]UBM62260.1 iron-containing alcohol dehydrogenase [Candidatus Sulfidibacterium hydrothermale]